MPELYFLAGLWVSLVGVILAATVMLPSTKEISQASPALLYKVAMNEELHRPTVILPDTGKLISVDLNTMVLSLYEDGVLKKTFPVLSRGRDGTAWETPTGKYSIQTKEPKHLSSIGGTWMPYSMQFYGNFFIHGWPTYMNGDDVPEGYSGGCIRLSTSDAKEVYDFSTIGTRVFVSGGIPSTSFATTSRYYLHTTDEFQRKKENSLPDISATSFVVTDVASGDVLWEHNATLAVSPGHLTALATALTAVETIDQYKLVRMGELLLGRSILRKVSEGAPDEVPVGALIYPLLYDTSDTAAQVFEREHGVRQFTAYMNEKARAIGMTDTSFGGASSLSTSTTTARDLNKLLRYVDLHKHFLIAASLSDKHAIVDASGHERYEWLNKNPWVVSGDARYRGGISSEKKSGIASGMVLFDLPVSEFGDRKVAIVLIDSRDIAADILKLNQFITDHYVYGIERKEQFIREENEPTPSLLQKASSLIDLERLLKQDMMYEKEV